MTPKSNRSKNSANWTSALIPGVLALVFLVCVLLLAGEARAGKRSYVLGVGDVLTFTIFAGGKTQESLQITVSGDGTVNIPFLGPIKADGSTIAALTKKIRDPLARDYFVDPQVIINVKEVKSAQAYVTGAVNQPGLYALEKSITLLELIARAGGLTKDRGNFAYILRGSIKEGLATKEIDKLIDKRKEASVTINLKELLDRGDTSKNVPVGPGDVVYIQPSFLSSDSSQYKVYVLGKVKSPGAFDYQEGLSALNACALAGGFDKYAAPNRVIITRKNPDGSVEKIKVNLEKVQEGVEKDLPLKAGDRVYVPESWF